MEWVDYALLVNTRVSWVMIQDILNESFSRWKKSPKKQKKQAFAEITQDTSQKI